MFKKKAYEVSEKQPNENKSRLIPDINSTRKSQLCDRASRLVLFTHEVSAFDDTGST